ncbi:hypothetical protein BC628DRAFT_252516 [Trametes gibbosa]|nr:hypothetical protein BC628DRAFT_252516 [Trametes gibbosa]
MANLRGCRECAHAPARHWTSPSFGTNNVRKEQQRTLECSQRVIGTLPAEPCQEKNRLSMALQTRLVAFDIVNLRSVGLWSQRRDIVACLATAPIGKTASQRHFIKPRPTELDPAFRTAPLCNHARRSGSSPLPASRDKGDRRVVLQIGNRTYQLLSLCRAPMQRPDCRLRQGERTLSPPPPLEVHPRSRSPRTLGQFPLLTLQTCCAGCVFAACSSAHGARRNRILFLFR